MLNKVISSKKIRSRVLHFCTGKSRLELSSQFFDLRTEAGHAAVVRNGYHPARPFQTSIGPVSVHVPKVVNRREKKRPVGNPPIYGAV